MTIANETPPELEAIAERIKNLSVQEKLELAAQMVANGLVNFAIIVAERAVTDMRMHQLKHGKGASLGD